jgi:acyl-CoA synthetase (AMP-forming)/AMP-acid ligase II
VLATATYEKGARNHFKFHTQVTLGLLPMSHIYGLVTVALCAAYQGDELIVLPKFTIDTFLDAIQRFKLRRLYVVCNKLM